MSDVLESFAINVEEIVEEMRYHWMDRGEADYNSTAFTKVKNQGSNIMFCCPFHSESNPSAGIRTEHPYGFNCFGCGESGNLGYLVAKAVGLPSEIHGLHWLTKNYITASKADRKPLDLESIIDGTQLDRRRSLPDDEVTKYAKQSHPYIFGRGFSQETVTRYEVGYDEDTRAVTFPVRTSKGNLRFIKKRYVQKKGFLNEKDIDKKDIIYGLYYILQAKSPITRIKLTESETDTMACYEGRIASGAILGRILFADQVRELIKAGIQVVDLFFDNDEAGVSCTIQAYYLLAKMSAIRVNVVLYPMGHWGIDEPYDEETGEMLYKDANNLLNANRLSQIKVVTFEEFYDQLDDKIKNSLETELKERRF